MCQWHIATAVAFPQKRNPTRFLGCLLFERQGEFAVSFRNGHGILL